MYDHSSHWDQGAAEAKITHNFRGANNWQPSLNALSEQKLVDKNRRQEDNTWELDEN